MSEIPADEDDIDHVPVTISVTQSSVLSLEMAADVGLIAMVERHAKLTALYDGIPQYPDRSIERRT